MCLCFGKPKKQVREDGEPHPVPHRTGHGRGGRGSAVRGDDGRSTIPAAATGGAASPPTSRVAAQVHPPVISHTPLSAHTVDEAIRLLAHALKDNEYAIIGGVAVALLGSARATQDIDVLVPDGHHAPVAKALLSTGKFGGERQQNGRYRVWFNASNRQHYNVDIMEPRDIHQQFPSAKHDRIKAHSGYVLSPAQLLNFKCAAWQSRHDGRKRLHDSQDILFLLAYMVEKGIKTTPKEIFNATDDFFFEFFGHYPHSRKSFAAIGLKVP